MSRFCLNRRRFLASGLAAGAACLGPRRVRAEVAASDRRFVFVHAFGGWDVTQVFTPELLGSAYVDTEAEAEAASLGDLSWVSHPTRPSVDAFFTAWGDRTAVFNGISVSSISHGAATRLLLTSTVGATEGDWAARMASASPDYVLPCLVAAGPSFAGPHGVYVGRAGMAGQLSALTSGDALTGADLPADPLSDEVEGLVEAYLSQVTARRASELAGLRAQTSYAHYEEALSRAAQLRALSDEVDLNGGETFAEQCDLAVRALASGLSRIVSINHPDPRTVIAYDTHTANALQQAMLLEDLFASLGTLMEDLAATPGNVGETLADETVIVVLSEMGRTPNLNPLDGKEHWPFTSAMVVAPGLGGRVIGGYDERQLGTELDLETGEAVAEGQGELLTPSVLGATLLALAGSDPGDHGLTVDPVEL